MFNIFVLFLHFCEVTGCTLLQCEIFSVGIAFLSHVLCVVYVFLFDFAWLYLQFTVLVPSYEG